MADKLAENIESDYLTCSICLERYTDPRVLPCGHTYCCTCLRNHIIKTVTKKEDKVFLCPLDRRKITVTTNDRNNEETSIFEWSQTFPRNLLCSCVIRSIDLCKSASWKGGDEKAESVCEKHGVSTVHIYCIGCRKLECAICAHQTHRLPRCRCMSVEEATEYLRNEINILRERLKNQYSCVRRYSELKGNSTNDLDKSKEKALAHIEFLRERFETIYTSYHRGLRDLRLQVDAAYGVLQEENVPPRAFRASVAESHRMFEDAIQGGRYGDVLRMLGDLQANAQEHDAALSKYEKKYNGQTIEIHVDRNLDRFLKTYTSIGEVRIIKDSPALIKKDKNPMKRGKSLDSATPCRNRRGAISGADSKYMGFEM